MGTILVIGAGFMGSGISQVCAQAGWTVHLMDIDKDALKKATEQIRWSLKRLFSKGRLTEPVDLILQRIQTQDHIRGVDNPGWVIEAATEREELKHRIFGELDNMYGPDIPLASNTSTIPISRLAEPLKHPQRVLGLHFFGPVPLMGLVEVVKGAKTLPTLFDAAIEFVKSLGKTPLPVRQDIPGFVVNRVFAAAFRKALELVHRGVATPEEVDIGLKLGYGWVAGPFEVADNAGIDTFLLVGESMEKLGEPHLAARSEILRNLVTKGEVGRKAGKGFYEYGPDGTKVPRPLFNPGFHGSSRQKP